VLSFNGLLNLGSSPIIYTVPSGKVCKIEATGLSGEATNVYLNINGINYINQVTYFNSGTPIGFITKQETIWLKAGD